MRRASHPVGALIIVLITLSLIACQPRRLVLVLPGPLVHDVGIWADEDLLCVAIPILQQVYLTRRCVPMATIRAVILQTQRAGGAPVTPRTSTLVGEEVLR